MGRNAYIVKWDSAKLGGDSEFYDLIIKHFENGEGENYVTQENWEDFLENHPEIAEKFPEEIKEVQEDLTANNGSVSYDFF